MATNDELIDIVDAQDRVIKTMWRSEASKNWQIMCDNKEYRRAALSFVANKKGEICLMRRTENKSYLPGYWAIPGGGVMSGESYEAAFKRELQEEVGINAQPENSRYLGYLKPFEDGYNEGFKQVFEVIIEDESHLILNANDFSESFWLTPHQLVEFTQKDNVAPGLLFLVRQFYGIK